MIEDFLQYEPYELDKEKKQGLLKRELIQLTAFHEAKCQPYSNFLAAVGYSSDMVKDIADIPFFPVRAFKELDLLSIPKDQVFKTMTSSGTSGQRVSKIFVDRDNAILQQKVMTRILADYWGKKRIPLLVIDSPAVIKDRSLFSARGAAIIGLSVVAKETTYALTSDMNLDLEVVQDFLERHKHERFIIFGFTFMVWQHFYKELCKLKESDVNLDFSEAFLMTGGGWKKLESEKVSRNDFKEKLREICHINHFLDHYGMVEQTGSIYAECEYGHLHASIFSDVIVRRPEDFAVCNIGEKGIIQVVSVLPHSYPGHSLLTEDEGMVMGEDDCPCGRKGKYIKILGRLKKAELRGCSDIYGKSFA